VIVRRILIIIVFIGFLSCNSLWSADAGNTGNPLVKDLIFFEGFEPGRPVYLSGGFAYELPTDPQYRVEGKFCDAYRLEPPYGNLFKPEIASPVADLKGFSAGQGVELRYDGKNLWQNVPSLMAKGSAGVLWQTVPVELPELEKTYDATKVFLASVYLRSSTPGVKVRLELLDEIDETDWRKPIVDAGEAALKNDPKAVMPKLVETVHAAKDVKLTADWQRFTASLTVDSRRPTLRLSLKLTLLEPATAEVAASALLLEKSYWHKQYAGPWIPGGKQCQGSAIEGLPLGDFGFSGRSGTISLWKRSPAAEGGGDRNILWLTGGGSFDRKKPCWGFLNNEFNAGKSTVVPPLPILQEMQRSFADGKWHLLTLTWDKDLFIVYFDGKEIGRKEYVYVEPESTASLMIGRCVYNGKVYSSAFLDDLAIWRRALTAEEVKTLANAGQSLSASLPGILIKKPARMIFHRGEESAAIDLLPLQLSSDNGDKKDSPASQALKSGLNANISVLSLGINEWVTLREKEVRKLTIKPWLAAPGIHQLSVKSDDGLISAVSPIEIIPSLPGRDFNMMSWGGDSGIKEEFGFTSRITDTIGLESVMREGLLACLRYEARAWHPLEPENLSKSLKSARETGHKAARYPHVYACLLNSEVGIGMPEKQWFIDWMKKETGIDSIPKEVSYKPMRVDAVAPGVKIQANYTPVFTENDTSMKFARWMLREGKGWPDLNAQLADVMRKEGLTNTLFYTDQPFNVTDLKGLDSSDFWIYMNSASALISPFNAACNIARLAGKKVSLMPGTLFEAPSYKIEGKHVCLSPDLMRQFLWIAMGNPLDNLGVFGVGNGRDSFGTGYVPSGTKEALRDTLEKVYPVGILTAGLPEGPMQVAYLYTEGQVWRDPGEPRWVESSFNLSLTVSLAETRLRYDTIGDDHVKAGWLKKYKAVVMPGARRIPEETYQALLAYAKNGGTVVVDKCCKAEIPGAVVLDIGKRIAPFTDAMRLMQEWGKNFAAKNPEALRLRDGDDAYLFDKTDGPANFVFVVNDRMKPGELGEGRNLISGVGSYQGPLRDKGEPQQVQLTLPLKPASAVYDLRAHKLLSPKNSVLDIDLNPGDSAVLALLPEPIGKISVTVPKAVKAGTETLLQVKILNASGKAIQHRDLMEIKVTDAKGTALDVQPYHRIVNGIASIPLRLPLFQKEGKIKLSLCEWISGYTETMDIQVLSPGNK
jgi:hypothetical protein